MKNNFGRNLFITALLTRLGILVIIALNTGNKFKDFMLTGDSFSYYHLALNLKYFFAFSILDAPFFSDAFLRTPGYPLFMSTIFRLFDNNLVALFFAQAILAAFTAVLIYKIANLIKLPTFVSVGAAGLFAVEPIIALFSNAILTETLFLFLLVLFFYLLFMAKVSRWHYLFLGILFGFNILVRPVLYPYLSIFIPLLILYALKRLKLNFRDTLIIVAIFIAGVYIIVFPWILRNKITFNSWNVSSISGVHFYYSHAVPFYAYLNGIKKDDAIKEIDIDIVGDKYDLRNDKIYKKTGREIITSHPVKYAFFHLSNSVSFFLTNGYRNIPRDLGFEEIKPPIAHSFIHLLITGKAKSLLGFFKEHKIYFLTFVAGGLTWLFINLTMIFGVFRGILRKKSVELFILFLTILYFAAVAGPEAYYKMRFPVNPFIFMLSFYGMYEIYNSKILTFIKKFNIKRVLVERKKLLIILAIIIAILFISNDLFYWVTLDNFSSPLREIHGDTSLYVNQLNSVLQHGKPTGNPYFIENAHRIGRFFVFGTLFSLIPFVSVLSTITWTIIFRLLVPLLVFWLFARILKQFYIPDKYAYLTSFAFVLFYGPVTFRGGSALTNWFLPAFLLGLLFLLKFYKSDKPVYSLLALGFFSFHPIYFAFGTALSGILWLNNLYKKHKRRSIAAFLVWLTLTLTIFYFIFLPFVHSSDPNIIQIAKEMTFRNTQLLTRFPFLFLFAVRYLLVVLISLVIFRSFSENSIWKKSWFFILVYSFVAFWGLNSYVVTGNYYLQDHFPFLEDFMVVPAAALLVFGPTIKKSNLLRYLGYILLLVSLVSIAVIWNYLNFKPVYFGRWTPQYLGYLIIAIWLSFYGIKNKLVVLKGVALAGILSLAIFHSVFMNFWDDKYWLPLNVKIQEYRGLLGTLEDLPDGVILSNPYISNLILANTGHKSYWSPIALHDLVGNEELYQRWIRARAFFPEEPYFNNKAGVYSVYGARDNKCREFHREIYLTWLSKLGVDNPKKVVCDRSVYEKWPIMKEEAEKYREALLRSNEWDSLYRIDYMVVESGVDEVDSKLLSRFFQKVSGDDQFTIYAYLK